MRARAQAFVIDLVSALVAGRLAELPTLSLCYASQHDDQSFSAFLLGPRCVISSHPARYEHHPTNTITAFVLCTRLSKRRSSRKIPLKQTRLLIEIGQRPHLPIKAE